MSYIGEYVIEAMMCISVILCQRCANRCFLEGYQQIVFTLQKAAALHGILTVSTLKMPFVFHYDPSPT